MNGGGQVSLRLIKSKAVPPTHVNLFRSLRTVLLTLIKTMQPRRANVICVRLHTRKLTRRPRTVADNSDRAANASPGLRELIACV